MPHLDDKKIKFLEEMANTVRKDCIEMVVEAGAAGNFWDKRKSVLVCCGAIKV